MNTSEPIIFKLSDRDGTAFFKKAAALGISPAQLAQALAKSYANNNDSTCRLLFDVKITTTNP